MQSAPKHLRAASRRWWSEVMGQFALEAHQVELLTLAAEARDRCTEAREIVKRDGPMIATVRGSIRCSRWSVTSRLAFARLVRELGLSDDAQESRPPYLPNRYAG